MNKKKKIILIFVIIIALISIASITFGYYFQSVNIHFNTHFEANIASPNYGYVRAVVITDWVNTNGEVVAKNPWELKQSAINSGWTKKDDGYYYLNNAIEIDDKTSDELTNEVMSNSPLINDGLSAAQLSDESLSTPKYRARYKVIYEMLFDDSDIGENVTQQAWNVVYTNQTLVP